MSNWGKALSETREYLAASGTPVPLGFPLLDERLPRGGARPGHVVLVIARSEVGKSAFASQVCVNNARLGTPSLYVSAEMVTAEVVVRMLSAETGLAMAEVEERVAGQHLDASLLAANEVLKVVSVMDKPGPTWQDIEEALTRATHRPKLVVVDHLQLLKRDRYTKGAERVQHITEEAKVFAKRHDVVLVLLHQVARAYVNNVGADGETKNLKNHGDLPLTSEDGFMGGEQDADAVVGLYRPERTPGRDPSYYEFWVGKLVVQLLKNRHGPAYPQGVACDWRRPAMRIEQWGPLEELLRAEVANETLGR